MKCLIRWIILSTIFIFSWSNSVWATSYKLPYQSGVTSKVSRTTSHPLAKEKNAIDFAMSVGTQLVASAAGTVVMVKENSNESACDSSYANKGNYVVIQHDDGSQTLYLHLSYNSVSVSKDEYVSQGQPIGLSGQTGYSCGAHLHFQRQENCGIWWCNSLPISFDDVSGGTVYPGNSYLSENYLPPSSSEFNGAGSLIKPTLDCWGCNRDEAVMQPSSVSSTVVFQWMQEGDMCKYLNIEADSGLNVLISRKAWTSTNTDKTYLAKLPVTIPNSGIYTITSVTSLLPVQNTTSIYAYCSTTDKNVHNRTETSSIDIIFSNGYTWGGNGSVISKDTGTCMEFGCTKDWAIALNKRALTAFQWQTSPRCQSLRFRRNDDTGASSDPTKGFVGNLKYKKWDSPDWVDEGVVIFPKTISTSNSNYYVFMIGTMGGEIPSGKYIEATCK